jgi:hypothetical protein
MAKISEFKKLANMAKQRLKEGNYSDKKGMKNNFYNSYYYKNISSIRKLNAELNFVLISENEDDNFNKKVFDLLSKNEDTLSPISKLCDYNIYSKLNEYEKQDYILRICEKFTIAKELYYKNLDKKIS